MPLAARGRLVTQVLHLGGARPRPGYGGLLEEPVEIIVVDPLESDLPMLEAVAASGDFRMTSVVQEAGGPLAQWFDSQRIPEFDDLASVTRLIPGVLVLFLGTGLPGAEVMQTAAAHGLSVLSRDSAARLIMTVDQVAGAESSPDVINRYRRLVEDYFPTSRTASTSVKLAACLTEATTLWRAQGGMILTGVTGGGSLAMTAQRGFEMSRDMTIPIEPLSALGRCFTRGRNETADEAGAAELLPGLSPACAALLAIKTGSSVKGMLLLWSGSPGAFKNEDLPAMSLFAHYIAMLLEVDELSERLCENLITDPLTGLHNRRQFDHRLRQEMLRANRYTLNLSLVVFDIDNLEAYNTACGQMLGNLALSDIASIMLKGTREVDFVARIGGDEFAALLPETNRLGALRVADRLRSEVASYPFPMPEDGASASLTLSAGIANFPSSRGTEAELLARAHRALDLAKKEGPDTIKLWDDKLENAK